MSFANIHLPTHITASIKNWIVRIGYRFLDCQEKPDDLVIPSKIVTRRCWLQTLSRPLTRLFPLFPRFPLSLPRRRRRNCRRNISASNVARLIRKVRRNIRNYGTHFSRTGRNNEEKTAQLVTTYRAINGTARLWFFVYVYMSTCIGRRAAPPTKLPIYLEIAHLACSPTPRSSLNNFNTRIIHV